MGSSRDIAIGPVAVVSLLVGTMLQDVIDPTENEVEYRRLAFTATFFAGITQATLGFFRYLTPYDMQEIIFPILQFLKAPNHAVMIDYFITSHSYTT